MMRFGEKLRAFARNFGRISVVPLACYCVARVAEERFGFPLVPTALALFTSVRAYEQVVFKQEDE